MRVNVAHFYVMMNCMVGALMDGWCIINNLTLCLNLPAWILWPFGGSATSRTEDGRQQPWAVLSRSCTTAKTEAINLSVTSRTCWHKVFLKDRCWVECSSNLLSDILACVLNRNLVGEDSVSLAASLGDWNKWALTGKSCVSMQSAKPFLPGEILGSERKTTAPTSLLPLTPSCSWWHVTQGGLCNWISELCRLSQNVRFKPLKYTKKWGNERDHERETAQILTMKLQQLKQWLWIINPVL